MSKYRYTGSVWLGEGGEFWFVGKWPQTDKHLPQSLFTVKFFRWRHFALTSIFKCPCCKHLSQDTDDILCTGTLTCPLWLICFNNVECHLQHARPAKLPEAKDRWWLIWRQWRHGSDSRNSKDRKVSTESQCKIKYDPGEGIRGGGGEWLTILILYYLFIHLWFIRPRA